jgi:hypothetical protein
MGDALLSAFAVSLVCVCVCERVIHSGVSLFVPSLRGKHERAAHVVSSAVQVGVSGVFSVALAPLRVALGWVRTMVWVVGAMCVLAAVNVAWEEYPEAVVKATGYYNARVGPFAHAYLFFPLELGNALFKGVVPVYNGVIWVWRGLIQQGLLPALWDTFPLLMDMAVGVLRLGQQCTASVTVFAKGLGCEGQACLSGSVDLDLMSPMATVRDLAILSSRLAGSVCSGLAVPLDLVLYPLMDLNMAGAVHGLGNAALHALVHLPLVTYERCSRHGGAGAGMDVLMCTPDFEPAVVQLVSGLRSAGSLLDNWMNMGVAVAHQTVTGGGAGCSGPVALDPDVFRQGVLTGAQTTVGLTDWLMAATNGSIALFYGGRSWDLAPRRWGGAIDVRMGVAAVVYGDGGGSESSSLTQARQPRSRSTTTLMGCQCHDVAGGGIQVVCHFLPMSGALSGAESQAEVWFEDPTWAGAFRCEAVEISVRSVRWPARRTEGLHVAFGAESPPPTDCATKGTCESVDATIWLVPRCDLLPAQLCSNAAVGTSCFPFCMASRVSGSRNANPVLVNAERWREGKQLLGRDCVLGWAGEARSAGAIPWSGVTTAAYGQTSMSGATGSPLFATMEGTQAGCRTGVNTMSWVPKAAGEIVVPYVRREAQPFAISGDTILLEDGQPDGGTRVQVERLTGSQRDVYSLERVWNGLPAMPKRLVPIGELREAARAGLVVPREYSATRVPSTNSRDYVFYAVSPDLQVFRAYLDYCRDRTRLPQIQLMALSSYGPLRVYRVRAYCAGACVGDVSAQVTFSGFSDGAFTEASFPQDCGRVYNASIDGLEYVNEENVAVTVQVADASYDAAARVGGNSSFVTYWLHPQTMRVRAGSMWQSKVPVSVTAPRCITGPSLPHLGTLGTELMVASVHAGASVLGGVVYSAGLVGMWQGGGGACPLDSRGHSVVAGCGDGVFGLDDFFDSIDEATGVFWGIPVFLADMLSAQLASSGSPLVSPLEDLLVGLGAYGRETRSVLSAGSGGVVTLLTTPLPSELSGAWAMIQSPGLPMNGVGVMATMGGMARFTAKLFGGAGRDLLRLSVVRGELLTLSEVWRTFLTAVYEHRPELKSSVGDKAASACAGLERMLGGANPWGRLLSGSCLTSAALPQAMLDLFLELFVDAPLVKCMCRDSEGSVVTAYARAHCVPRAPPSLRPLLLGMISAAEGAGAGPDLLCPAVIAHTRKVLSGSVEPWFAGVYASLEALADSVDYLMVGFDSDAGQCSDFVNDPHVVVIMPQPMDYFQACGETTSCHSKCYGPWRALSEELERADPASLRVTRTVRVSVASKFFPVPGEDIIAPGQIVALTQPGACHPAVCESGEEGCVAVAAFTGRALVVRYYCLPTDPALSAYATRRAGLNWETAEVQGATQVGFLDAEGGSVAALVYGGAGARLCRVRRGSSVAQVLLDIGSPVESLVMLGELPLNILSFITVGPNLLVKMAVRTTVDGAFASAEATLWVVPDGPAWAWRVEVGRELWAGYASVEYPGVGGGQAGATAQLLFWPTRAGGAPQRVTLACSNHSVSVVQSVPFAMGAGLAARASLMPRRLVLAKGLRIEGAGGAGQLVMYASTGEMYDWLNQFRLMGDGALTLEGSSVLNSQPVQATVVAQSGCDGTDCRGCQGMRTRAVCAAYQRCAVVRCIGTAVNLKRPLCGVGQMLKSTGMLAVETTHGGWLIFVDIFMTLLELSTRKSTAGVALTAPMDAFFGNLCEAKDLSAEFFGIIMSAVNSILQITRVPVPLLQDAALVDSNANTIASLSTAAMIGFMHQVALAPIYLLAVANKISTCQIQGYLSVASGGAFTIELASARQLDASGAIGGQCLMQSTEVSAQQSGDAASQRSAGQALATMAVGGAQLALRRRLEPALHVWDGAMTYASGVLGSLANLLQTLDLQQCLLPDVTLKSAMQCACGDAALRIVPRRRAEGLAERAYWCSGTLSLIDADNRGRIVWNPYSYEEVQARLAGRLAAYLECAQGSVSCAPPNDEAFAVQGVNIVQVLTRCRQNYVNKQWDPAAFVQYDQEALDRAFGQYDQAAPAVGDAGDGVGACLLRSAGSGVGNGACLDASLSRRGLSSDAYWEYVHGASLEPQAVDACAVFSGPSSNAGLPAGLRQRFRNCQQMYGESRGAEGCDLSGFVWSPASSNTVPVAALHPIHEAGPAVQEAIGRRMAAAQEEVLSALAPLMQYENAELQAALFSAEGDVIHQMLDCVFMGPYGRMDYWPTLGCDEASGSECLVGPYWARDDAGGASRGIDVGRCESTGTLPFTCGSPSRKAMVKYFVSEYVLQGGSGGQVVAELVREWLRETHAIWSDAGRFGCDCPAGHAVANDPGCCALSNGSYLPRNLSERVLTLPTRSVLNALRKRMEGFYEEATTRAGPWLTWLPPSERAKYRWDQPEQAAVITRHALYDTSRPLLKYDGSDAMSPPSGAGGLWLWEMCHGALRQVFFTLPMAAEGGLRDPPEAFQGGGVEAIAEHVGRLVAGAYEDSPLFRHYAARHHPSGSTLCRGRGGDDPAPGEVRFADFVVDGTLILDGAGVRAIPSLGKDAARLGGWDGGCFCGWARRGGRCIVPAAACSALGLSGCSYAVGAEPTAALTEGFAGGVWECPYYDLTDHAGFLDPEATEAWLGGERNVTTSGEHLLRYGPGGVKAGNVETAGERVPISSIRTAGLRDVLRRGLSPVKRAINATRGVLDGCDEAGRLEGRGLLDEFVEALFPMAQGVYESGAGAYCLRYAIELGRLRAMELALGGDDAETGAQRGAASKWRRRCGTQVQLVSMCQALDVFRPAGLGLQQCQQDQHWILSVESGRRMYVTPQCLVHIDGVFYDPCGCDPTWCEASAAGTRRVTRAMLIDGGCRLRFDPRDVVEAHELGWWAGDDADPAAAGWNEWQREPFHRLDAGALAEGLLAEGRGAGNTGPGQHWATAEGFMNETSEFCDMIADYWPEDGRFPAGYHVTLPCDAGETAYRSFDNVFAGATDGAGGEWMVYMEDETRERDLVDSHFGAGGLCRGTNFGVDMYETNTMRVCTRAPAGEDVDMHVPMGPNAAGGLGPERCSATSGQAPWDESAPFGVGTIPNLPRATDRSYPSSAELLMHMGPQQAMRAEGWGADCQDFGMPNCSDGWRCPSEYVCMEGGVCQHRLVECVQHDDCPGERMCSGTGRCVRPKVTVLNEREEGASVRAHAGECAGEAFSMRGASAWAYVPDMLPAHGMCSYRHWREYLHTLDRCGCSSGSQCQLNATGCTYYLFDRADNNNMWWDRNSHFPNRLKMLPTTCDRDYERFMLGGREMKACVPTLDRMRLTRATGQSTKSAERERLWQTYDAGTKTTRLGVMPFRGSASFGFLGSATDPRLQSCNKIQQCFSDTFTRNGRVSMAPGGVMRPLRTRSGGVAYDPNDIFRCGAVGFFNKAAGRCQVDARVAPLYEVLCNPAYNTTASGRCAGALVAEVADMCEAMRANELYEQRYTVIHDVVVPALLAFFGAFRRPTNLVEHLATVGCLTHVYDAIASGPFESKGVYYPFVFTLYELPFAWFYQCTVHRGIVPQQDLSRTLFACPNYERPSEHGLGAYAQTSPDFARYISSARAGFTTANVTRQIQSRLGEATRSWERCVNQSVRAFYGGVDRSQPMCFSRRAWNLTTGSYVMQRLIETFVRPTCASNTRAKFLGLHNANLPRSEWVPIGGVVDILTYNDESSLVAQRKRGQTLLLSGSIRQFGLERLQQSAALSSIASAWPLRFDGALPGVGDTAYVAARDTAWRSLYQPREEDTLDPVADPWTCADNAPKRELYSDPTLDTDRARTGDASARVRVCPVYTTGLLGCKMEDLYLPSGERVSYTGADADPSRSYAAYADALYGTTKQCYDQLMTDPATQPGGLQPDPLSFFEDEASLGFTDDFRADLTRVSKFMANIQPDLSTPIMCVASNQTIDYTACTDENFGALQRHVEAAFAREGGVVVPGQQQLDWYVSRQMMEAGGIFSFATAERNVSRQFLRRMLDPQTACSGEGLGPADRICSVSSDAALSTNRYVAPWMSGDWNPYDRCDVSQTGPTNGFTERVDVQCYYEPMCAGPDRKQMDAGVEYYKSMPYSGACMGKNGLKTTQINVPAASPYNLCRQTLQEDPVCMHIQGMLGGTDGYPMEDYAVNGDMYSLHNFSAFPSSVDRLFENPLLAGQATGYGFVRSQALHIGGEHLIMVIGGDTMRVAHMPLIPVDDGRRVDTLGLGDVSGWVRGWRAAVEGDHAAYLRDVLDKSEYQAKDEGGAPVWGWDCPLRRRAYYTGAVAGFTPSLPSARRSRRIFGGLTGGLFAHPTQVRAAAQEYGLYKTGNGFCFCPVSSIFDENMCNILVRETKHNCSLYQTTRAMQGRQWGWSHTFKPQTGDARFRQCTVQTDWPFIKGAMRDGQRVSAAMVEEAWGGASDREAQQCHVLDRAHDFAYTFVSKDELNPSGFTTLDRGVCHTGRVQAAGSPPPGVRCVRKAKAAGQSTLLCSDGVERVRQRRGRVPAATQAGRATQGRRSCGKCTPPPRFRSRQGTPIEAESSFGLPYRVSAERVLANDLRRALCKGRSDCLSLLNLTHWEAGRFMATYLKEPRRLFKEGFPGAHAPVEDPANARRSAPSDEGLWARPWVYCPSAEALRTGANCSGSIAKQDWRRGKVQTCHAVITQELQGRPDPMAATSVCQLDSRLGALCRTLEKARSAVAAANCLASGDARCRLQEFVYSPSTWETTNQEFVHQTVAQFYRRADEGCRDGQGACVCPPDPNLAAFLAENAYKLSQCSAVPVMVARTLVENVKNMGHEVVEAGFHLVGVLLNLVLTMSSTHATSAKRQMLLEWNAFRAGASGALDNGADILTSMAFDNGAVGPYLREMLKTLCAAGNTAYAYFSGFWCGLVINQLPVFLGNLKSIGFWIETGFGVVNDVFGVVLNNFLPEAMLVLTAKGYKDYFHSSKYREKTQAYSDKRELDRMNPKQLMALTPAQRARMASGMDKKAMDNLMEAAVDRQAKSLGKKTLAIASNLKGPAAAIAAIVELGWGIADAIDDIQLAKRIAEAAATFPQDLTVFEFSGFYEAIDSLAEYIDMDVTCYSVTEGSEPFTCAMLGLATPGVDDVQQMSPVQSTCWAEAQQRQVGVSTLYSCAPTSTCCDGPLCGQLIMCGSCPVPPSSAVRAYGCNTVVQRCQCGVEAFSISRCSSQRECGPKASCSLVTSTREVSWGSLQECTLCAVPPVCLMGSGPQSGECTCLTTTGDLSVHRCSTVGRAVYPGHQELCGYAQEGGRYFAWSEIALVVCGNAIQPVCTEVRTDAQDVIYMAVSQALRGGGSPGRRLLGEGREDAPEVPLTFSAQDPVEDVTAEGMLLAVTGERWNHTAAPCSSLAQMFERGSKMGPVDEATLHGCVYWRRVGRRIIEEYNLSALNGSDTFLLSPDDFAAALGQRGAVAALMGAPQALLSAALYSRWLKPVRAFLAASYGQRVARMVRGASEVLMERVAKEVPAFRDGERRAELFFGAKRNSSRGRRLMEAGAVDEVHERLARLPFYAAVQASARKSRAATRNASTAFAVVQTASYRGGVWGPFNAAGPCPPASAMLTSVTQVARILRRYYEEFSALSAPRKLKATLREAMPEVPLTLSFSPAWEAGAPRRVRTNPSPTTQLGDWVLDQGLWLIGGTRDGVMAFLSEPCADGECTAANRWTMTFLIESATFCDLESVIFCSEYRRDMWTSAVLGLLFYAGLYVALELFGFAWLAAAAFYGIPMFILWFSLGVSPRCFPMVPTCMLDAVLDAVKGLVPVSAEIPALLLAKDGASVRSCAGIGLDGWQDPLLFALCDAGVCDGWSNVSSVAGVVMDVGSKRAMQASADAGAYRVCSIVMAVNTASAAGIGLVCVAAASAAAWVLVSMCAPLASLLWHVAVYDHE